MEILSSHVGRYKWVLLLVVFLASINQVFSLLDPLIFRHIIDDYATKFDTYTKYEFFKGIFYLLFLSVGVAFVSRVAKNFQDYFLNNVTQRIGAEIYSEGVQHSLALPYEMFEDQRSGETLGVLQKTRTESEKFIASVINVLLISLIGFVFVTIYAIQIYWLIAVVFASIVPVMGGVSLFLTRKIKLIQKQILDETTALSGSTTESLRNIELVKSLGLVDQEVNRLNSTTEKILALELKKLRYVRSISFIQGTIINFLRTLILLFLLYLVFNKTISFGQFFSLYIYQFFIFGPLQEMGNLINNYRDLQVTLSKYKKIFDTPKEEIPKDALKIENITELEFKDVSFKYHSAKTEALKDISFKVNSGMTIAFVGPSGSGKTSLVKLLVGLYKPQKGSVLFNQNPIDKIDIDYVRTQFGFVTQDTQLFAGSIKENLLFVNPKATDEECRDALIKSAAKNLIERAENGIDTIIGEGGIKVSGGEKQRISIARALLRKPKIMIFDEATSALDSITEEEISKTIRDISLDAKHITIIIAHRLSTIMHADVIYVLEKGAVIESGTHNDLLKKEGLYSAMWRQQIGERVD